MKNNTPTLIPPISMTDEKGVQWTFDFDANRWTAIVDGKKMSSKDFSQLSDKVQTKHTSQSMSPEAKARVDAAVNAKPIEVALVSISRRNRQFNSNPSMLGDSLVLTPIVAKVEWDAQKGEMQIVRYKDEESGWKSSDANLLVVFHPQHITPELKEFLSKSLEGAAARLEFSATEHAIGKTWWNHKEDSTQCWDVSRQEGLRKTPHTPNRSNRSSYDFTNPTLLMAEPINTPDFTSWVRQDDGSLKFGDAIVKMEKKKNGYGGFDTFPSFYVYGPQQESAVYESRSLVEALTLGQATQFIASQPSQVVSEWCASGDWLPQKASSLSWPVLRHVHGAVVFAAPRDQHSFGSPDVPHSYVLSEDEGKHAWNSEKQEHAKEKLEGLNWVRSNPFYASPSFRHAGPEDEALVRLDGLRKGMMTMAQTRNLFAPHKEFLDALTQETLSTVCGEIENGEEYTNDVAVMKKMMDTTKTNILAKLANTEEVVAWRDQCQKVKDDTIEAIQSVRAQPGAASKKKHSM